MSPLVIALGDKKKQGDDDLSFHSGEVFQSIPSSEAKNGYRWVQGKKTDGRVGWYPKEYTQSMVKYRINQFGMKNKNNLAEERKLLEGLTSGYLVRSIVRRKPLREDEIPLDLNDILTKLEHEVEPGWSRGKKNDFVGVFPTRAVIKLLSSKCDSAKKIESSTSKVDHVETRPRIKLGKSNLTVRRQGSLKCRDTSDKLFLRSSWHPFHFVLAANYLLGFKSQKQFIQMTLTDKILPTLIIDLNGSTIEWKAEKENGFLVETIFGAMWSFKGSNFYDEKPWYLEIESTISDFRMLNQT